MADPTTPQEAFVQFERDHVRVPDEQVARAKEVHPQIRSHLESQLPDVAGHFIAGSYKRKTQAGTLKDVDLVLELSSDRLYRPASETLEEVRAAAAKSDLVARASKAVRAVKLTLHDEEFTVDIVPAVSFGDDGHHLTRRLVDEGIDDWTLEHPSGQTSAAQRKNQATDGTYVRMVRILKFWNQGVAKPSRALRSYQLEAITYHSFQPEMTYPEGVAAFFDAAYQYLAPGVVLPDPGHPLSDVFERLTEEDRSTARARIERARIRAHEAIAIEDPLKQMEAWAGLFGQAFPVSDEHDRALRGALREGTARASRAGLSVETGRQIIPARSWREW